MNCSWQIYSVICLVFSRSGGPGWQAELLLSCPELCWYTRPRQEMKIRLYGIKMRSVVSILTRPVRNVHIQIVYLNRKVNILLKSKINKYMCTNWDFYTCHEFLLSESIECHSLQIIRQPRDVLTKGQETKNKYRQSSQTRENQGLYTSHLQNPWTITNILRQTQRPSRTSIAYIDIQVTA